MSKWLTILKRVLLVVSWIVLAGSVITLLVAAVQKKEEAVCQKVDVQISGGGDLLFINYQDVMGIIQRQIGGSPVGKPLAAFNIGKLEQQLEKNIWIVDAEIYIDNQQTLHVDLKERAPIARVFDAVGNSYYIDSVYQQLPLSKQVAARLPVFTEVPVGLGKQTLADSAMRASIVAFAQFFRKDAFWNAQIQQVVVTPNQQFEMIPVLGNHVIEVGTALNLEQKMNRLKFFYQQVLVKEGMDKYKKLSVAFANQVIAIRSDATSVRSDSLLMEEKLKAFLTITQAALQDSLPNLALPAQATNSQLQPLASELPGMTINQPVSITASQPTVTTVLAPKPAIIENKKEETKKVVSTVSIKNPSTNPSPVKKVTQSKPKPKPPANAVKPKVEPKPKAVMPTTSNNDY